MPDAGSNKGWFASLPNDSVLKTVIIATVLCLICSVVVSATAVAAAAAATAQCDPGA